MNNGNITFSVLPDDRAFSAFREKMAIDFAGNPALSRLLNASNTRNEVIWSDNTRFNEHWTGNMNYSSR